jgi:hypothetical protein
LVKWLILRREGTMLTKPPLADSESDSSEQIVPYVVSVDTPMACESLVAEAMRHLLAAFVMIKNPGRTSCRYGGSANALDQATEKICTVLERLNECSHAFWLVQKDGKPVQGRLRKYGDAFKRTRCARQDAPVREINSNRQFIFEGLSLTATEVNAWDTETTFALAILQLIGAYRAIDALSTTSFPTGAPYSFEIACNCLCAALVGLEEYSTGASRGLAKPVKAVLDESTERLAENGRTLE